MEPLTLVLIIAAAAIAALAGWFFARAGARETAQQGEAQRAAEAQIAALMSQTSELAGRLSQLAEAQATGQSQISKTLEERLDAVTQRLGASLHENSSKTAESLGQLHARLAVIDDAQKNITELSGQMVSLQDILANKQSRGAFGEIQLNDIVQNALPPSAYSFQTTLGNGKRADCLIRLPNPPGPIAIDSKFPLEAHAAIQNAADDVAKKTAERAFRTAIQTHIKDIAAKYIVPGETADSALMFLPSEAVYAELHASFPDLVQESFRARVWIVSPTTLMATLNTVRAVLKDAQMRKQAHVIQKEVTLLLKDVERLGTRVGNLQKHFEQTNKDVAQIATSTDKLIKRGERIADLEIEPAGEDALEDALPSDPLPRSDSPRRIAGS